jgi:hypothetical protein
MHGDDTRDIRKSEIKKKIKACIGTSPGDPRGIEAATDLLADLMVNLTDLTEAVRAIANSAQAAQHQLATMNAHLKHARDASDPYCGK